MDYTNRFLVKFYIDMHYTIFECQCKLSTNIEKTKNSCAAVVGADGARALGSRSAQKGRRLLACFTSTRGSHGGSHRAVCFDFVVELRSDFSERNSTTKSKPRGPMRASVRATRDVNKPAAPPPFAPSGCRALRRLPPPLPAQKFLLVCPHFVMAKQTIN
ncbi:unnamed protein product [Trichogramma brassicae]|uniref:Uncharacterized protein n=1 Tax=Trichogramma brassicae TaxID=86971 RepID=A0A6H5I6V1_9HYME|nr:unnamed protein product [Trichogramma brassicae]